MATLATNNLTYLDIQKRLDPKDKVAMIIEMLSQTNEVLMDMTAIQGNLKTGLRTTLRTGLPSVYWKLLNQGVKTSKSTTAQVDINSGTLQAWSEPEKELCDLGGNTNQVRLSEAAAFIEAMNQEMARTVFYGNSAVNPERFTGLSPVYSSKSAPSGKNIIDAGGTGSDNMSAWLVVWDENKITGFYPDGTTYGLVHKDFGTEVIETGPNSSERMEVYREKWEWKCGIAVRDWRYAVRIANIDSSALVKNDADSAKLLKLMAKATHRIHNLNGKACWYMNRTAIQELDNQRLDRVKDGGGITYKDVDGKNVYSFRGIPIRVCDALTETESQVE